MTKCPICGQQMTQKRCIGCGSTVQEAEDAVNMCELYETAIKGTDAASIDTPKEDKEEVRANPIDEILELKEKFINP